VPDAVGMLQTGVPAVLRMAVEGLRATGVAALVGGSPPGSELKVDMLTYVIPHAVLVVFLLTV
jgi:hypothetical protein